MLAGSDGVELAGCHRLRTVLGAGDRLVSRVSAAGAMALHAHAVAVELHLGDDRQRGDAGLRGAVVGLADVAEQPRRRRRVDRPTPSPACPPWPARASTRPRSASARSGPCRCTRTTSSHSASVMLVSMRSRRMPALFTSTCRSPNVSMAVWISRWAPSQSATSSVFATASPPVGPDLVDHLLRGPGVGPAAVGAARRGRSPRPWRPPGRTGGRARARSRVRRR